MRVEIIKKSSSEVCQLIIEQKVLTPEEVEVLHECVHWTHEVWIGVIDGYLVGAWGLAPMTLLSDRAYLWLWTPPNMPHQLTFIRQSKMMVEKMLNHYAIIHGVTDPNNHKAIKWLEWLGAKYTTVRDDGLLAFEIKRKKEWQTRLHLASPQP